MRLRDWLRHGEREELARMVGCSVGRISSVASGKLNPSVNLAERISLATNGKVTVKELMLGNRKAHPLVRWSDNDPMPTPEQVAAFELEALLEQGTLQADAPAAAAIHQEGAR